MMGAGDPAQLLEQLAESLAWEKERHLPGLPLRQTLPVEPAPAGDDLCALHQSWEGCTRCVLSHERTTIVFGEGAVPARLAFVGEGPGADEDASGRPFVGAAGELLTRMISAMGLRRDEVFITNIVKCRPPRNRDPEAEEVAACRPLLEAQLAIVRPEVIVTLGRPAAQALLHTAAPISRIRGRWARYGEIPLLPTFHPAYLLRQPAEKGPVWEDLKDVLRHLGLPVPEHKRQTGSQQSSRPSG